MQVLISLGLLTLAFAGDGFNEKVKAHSRAFNLTKIQVQRVGEAQKKFKELLGECAPKNTHTQESLLLCGKQFLQLKIEFQDLKSNHIAAEKAISAIPSEFTPAANALKATLDQSFKFVSLVTDHPEQVSNSFFNMSSIYVQKQFERTRRDSFEQARIRHYCEGFQDEINMLSKIATLSVDSKMEVPGLYKQKIRLLNTLALATEIPQICGKSYDVTALQKSLKLLETHLSPQKFSQYKNSVCKKVISKNSKDLKHCENQPFSPYFVYWMDALKKGEK